MMKKNNFKKPELLAPAGNLEKMKTAFAFGADAVYAGIPDFSLRTRINDFTLASLKEAVEYAHARGKKVYVTINIFAHNEHLAKLPAYLKELKKIQPDALIVSDPGVISLTKKHWTEAEIHLSTQANCTNGEAARFWFESGVKRVILGREVAYEDILDIKKAVPKLELETFIHGAMCMAYSGRCFLSKYLNNRSGNLGDCVQPCRWQYESKKSCHCEEPERRNGLVSQETMRSPQSFQSLAMTIKPDGHEAEFELVEEQHGSYILNSNDMCLMMRMPELVASGLSSLKIEGRAKSVYYLAAIVGAYRKTIDELCEVSLREAAATKQSGSYIKQDKIASLSLAMTKRDYDDNKKEADKVKKKIAKLYQELEQKLVHRGYTEGFMFGNGQHAQNLSNSHNECAWEFCGQVVGQKNGLTLVKVHNALRVGDQIEVLLPGYDIIRKKVNKIRDEETGELLESAHGGQGKMIMLDFKREVPEYSVLRRKIGKG